MSSRETELAKFNRCLNTEEGEALVAELRSAWATGSVHTPGDPYQTAYYAGLLDAFRQIEAYYQGHMLNDEVVVHE